ncbi:uncharacterized protein LOC132558848 [Ylistrum balloti]|uniref:uncharacterized protein LOC132558848 n=1 Tax=Ylistrum balloti TaxID=509963 RepID=UPI002905D115|nr:uncharacterized protein LOC132558848 [Ylistrum balloti]
MRGAPSDVTGGELDFSESERVYGRELGYGRIERPLETERRQGGNVESVGTVNLERFRRDGLSSRQSASMGYRDRRRVDSYGAGRIMTVPERRVVNHTSHDRVVNRNPDKRIVESRNIVRSSDRRHVIASPERRRVSPSPERRRVSPSPERYYVRETVETKPKVETVDKEVETCCCGCVEIVDSIYCCTGVKMLRCTCLDSAEEEEEAQKETVKQTEQPKKKDDALLRVFTKSATALYKVNSVPKGKSMMVRVGGGWMKVEHHRNHHIPLKVYEHNRDANRDKFLFIKSRFATKQKYVPIAYRKYREEIVRDPWDPSVKLT